MRSTGTGNLSDFAGRRIGAVDHLDRGKHLDFRVLGDVGDAEPVNGSDRQADQQLVRLRIAEIGSYRRCDPRTLGGADQHRLAVP